jgi:hypothetical protein
MTMASLAQVRIKGDKNVVTREREVPFFSKIEVIDNMDVFLSYSSVPSVTVETDSNLQDLILTEVTDEVLTIRVDDVAIRSKKLAVYVRVNAELRELYAYNNAKVESRNLLDVDSLSVHGFDNADFNLKLRSKLLVVNGVKGSKMILEALCDDFRSRLEESTSVKGVVDCKAAEIEVLDRASLELTGSTDELDVRVYGYGAFKGRGFISENARVTANNNGDIYVNTKNQLQVYARNSSKVYIYSDPQITLHEFFDKSALFKKN